MILMNAIIELKRPEEMNTTLSQESWLGNKLLTSQAKKSLLIAVFNFFSVLF